MHDSITIMLLTMTQYTQIQHFCVAKYTLHNKLKATKENL